MQSYRERHLIVNVWLWLVMFSYLTISIFCAYSLINNHDNNTRTIWLGILSILTLFKVLGTLLMLKWNRYGYYTFCACSFVAAFIIIVILNQRIAFGILEVVVALFTCSILRIKKDGISAWKYMNDGWDYKHSRHIYQLFCFFTTLLVVLTSTYAIPQAIKTAEKQEERQKEKHEEVPLSNAQIFAKAVELLDSDNTFNKGVSTIDSLAKTGMAEAIYKMAYLYMWIPNDSKNTEYKKRMGIAMEKEGDFKGMPKSDSINSKAVRLLQDVVKVTDSTHVEAMYYLGFYYANGIVLDRNYNQAKLLFEKAKLYAHKTKNSIMLKKTESVLMDINKRDYE